MNEFPQSAKRLITCVVSTGAIAVVYVLAALRVANAAEVAAWVAVAMLAGTLKVRFPGVESSYSFGYIVVLAAAGTSSCSEVLLVSMTTALVQCYWRASKKPRPVQVLFNVCNYALSGAVAWSGYHAVNQLAPSSTVTGFAFAAGVFFLVNSGLVSLIVALVSGRLWRDVWDSSQLRIVPYYLAGTGCAALSLWAHGVSSFYWLAMLPLFGILYDSMRATAGKPTV